MILKFDYPSWPDSSLAKRAIEKAEYHLSILADEDGYCDPLVNLSQEGEVVLEWWQGTRKLTIYVSEEHASSFVKVWGANTIAEMEDGEWSTIGDLQELFRWLHGREEGAQ